MPKQILTQILNKWHDLKYLSFYEPSKFDKGPIISNAVPDNCVLTHHGSVVIIDRIEEEGNMYFGRIYKITENFFISPIGSNTMGILQVKNNND